MTARESFDARGSGTDANARAHPLARAGRAILWIALYVTLGGGIAYSLASGYGWAARHEHLAPEPANVASWRLARASLVLLIGLGVATWVVGARLAARSWSEMGWRVEGSRWRIPKAGARGAVLGAAAGGLAVMLATLLGGASVRFDPGWSSDLGSVAPLAVGLCGAALVEECLFRGFPLGELANAFGKWPATLILAVAFGAAHLWNDHADAVGVVNVALAGVWLSAAFFSAGGMAFAWGLHWGWNFGLAVLDAPVSGISLGLPHVAYYPGSHPWVDGGAFGPEGGAVGTIAIGLGVVAVLGRRAPSPRRWFAA